MQGLAFINGKFVPLKKAVIPVMDIGLQRGYGVIEVLRTYARRPLAIDEHLRRLELSAKLINLKLPYNLALIRERVYAGLKKSKSGETLVKIILTGGDGAGLLSHGAPRLLILFLPYHPYADSYFQKGIRIMTSVFTRFEPKVKYLDYLWGVVSMKKALSKRFDEVLYMDNQKDILEGTTFNFGIVKNKKLIAPDKEVLGGITMAIAIKLARKLGLKIERRKIRYKELATADEAFITSTVREIMPVVQVDKIKISNGKPGKYTQKLLEEFRAEASKIS